MKGKTEKAKSLKLPLPSLLEEGREKEIHHSLYFTCTQNYSTFFEVLQNENVFSFFLSSLHKKAPLSCI